MFVRVLLLAILAGAVAGLFATAVQSFRVTPLILEAERYEDVEEGDAGHSHGEENGDAATADEPVEVWQPNDGFERTFFTGLTNVLVGVGFSLMITAGVLLANHTLTFSSGIIWGLAGFVTFGLAPFFGLPPELPGMPAGDLVERQVWWLATASCTAIALALFAFEKSALFMLLGLVLILAPHVYGAPRPISHESLVPANLAAEFAVASVVSSLLFWLFLGGLLGWLFEKKLKQDEDAS